MADDEYNKKLESLQQYIPFLNNMITQLKDPRKKNREQQLAKMVSLHSMITDKKKKLKLETLAKCEDVILKLYEKVKSGSQSLSMTPRPTPLSPTTPSSPSPPRDLPKTKPVVIPTEKVVSKAERDNNLLCQPGPSFKPPRIDIYSSAADSLKSSPKKQSVLNPLSKKPPDMLSKPPISLEDLEALQKDDITDNMSLNELNDLKANIQKALKNSDDENKKINTTIRNTTILTKKAVEKAANDKMKNTENKDKPKPHQSIPKTVKVIREESSIFASTLSSIDNQILEKSANKEKERRNSNEKHKERRHSNEKTHTNHRDKDRRSEHRQQKEHKKEEEKPKKDEPVYKRLADKYNPKPRKQPQPEPIESKQTFENTSPIKNIQSPLLSPTASTNSIDSDTSFTRKPLLPSAFKPSYSLPATPTYAPPDFIPTTPNAYAPPPVNDTFRPNYWEQHRPPPAPSFQPRPYTPIPNQFEAPVQYPAPPPQYGPPTFNSFETRPPIRRSSDDRFQNEWHRVSHSKPRDPRLHRGYRDDPRANQRKDLMRDPRLNRREPEIQRKENEESFMSPLDSLYSEDNRKTGKGYGVQNFKIPKLRKEDEIDEIEIKDTSMEDDEPVASTSVSSSTEIEIIDDSPNKEKETTTVGEISSTNDLPENQTRDENKELGDEGQTDIINKFLKKLLQNERTRAAASLFIDNVSSSLDDDKLKMVVQTVKSEEEVKKRLIRKKKLIKKTKFVVKKKQLMRKRLEMRKRRQQAEAANNKTKEQTAEEEEEKEVLTSVGERIKTRQRDTPPKKKKKGRLTELDMLHEDIQEMFIRDGVLTATGKRMCRLLKNDDEKKSSSSSSSQIEQSPRRRTRHHVSEKIDLEKLKAMSSVRVLIPKLPDDQLADYDEDKRYSLRKTSKSQKSYAEVDTDEEKEKEKAKEEVEKVVKATPPKKDEEKVVATPKRIKKRAKSWASGVLPKRRKRIVEEPKIVSSPTKVDFVEPDKNYYSANSWHAKAYCKLCDFYGNNITKHYRTTHPDSEVLSSRLSPEKAEEAKSESLQLNLDEQDDEPLLSTKRFQFRCRFCNIEMYSQPSSFYDHVSTHTGEYRHSCNLCNFTACSVKPLRLHCSKVHNTDSYKRASWIKTKVYGYICTECNFVQISRKTVENHVNIYHLGEGKKILKIALSTVRHKPEIDTELDEPVDIVTKVEIEEPELCEPDAKRKKDEAKMPKEKEIDMTVFTCNTDLLEENEMIEKERLRKMTELNDSVKTNRQSLNFIDELSNRLMQEQVEVKIEPMEEVEINPEPEQIKKPTKHLESVPQIQVVPKDNSSIQEMIEKLQGKLKEEPNSDTLPPLAPLIKQHDDSKAILSAGFLTIYKIDNNLEYLCRVPSCLVTSTDRDTFLKHWKEDHIMINQNYKTTICRVCNAEIRATPCRPLLTIFFEHIEQIHLESRVSFNAGCINVDRDHNGYEYCCRVNACAFSIRNRETFLDHLQEHFLFSESCKVTVCAICKALINASTENNILLTLFTHLEELHLDEVTNTIRMRRLPGDKLSTLKDESPETKEDEENPFPFKISGVMSLADESIPPLSPITDKANTKVESVVLKEFKISPLKKHSNFKSPQAMKKFLHIPHELYKCPQYGCKYATAYRQRFDMHLKVHYSTSDEMVLCVYCDIKTPLSHAGLHIDLRHSNCLYSCSYCLYRSLCREYVMAHNQLKHPNEESTFIVLPPKTTKTIMMSKPKNLTVKEACPPLKCGYEACNRVFLFWCEYEEHLKTSHDKMICGDCNKDIQFEELRKHYNTHGCYLYHCLMCKIGTNELLDMLEHYSECHANAEPLVVDRRTSNEGNAESYEYSDEAVSKIMYVKEAILDSLVARTERPTTPAQSFIFADSSKLTEPIVEQENSVDPLEVSGDDSDSQDVSENVDLSTGLVGSQLYKCAFCKDSFGSARDFKAHTMTSKLCRLNSSRPLMCYHCRRLFKNPHGLLEHIQYHGQLRFGCSLCVKKFPSSFSLKLHMRTKHNITNTITTPVIPTKNNLELDEFVIRPVQTLEPEKITKEVTAVQELGFLRSCFGPDEIELLPQRYIFSANIKCALCPYSTKVRTNLIRHLQFHSSEKSVPDIAPVNPVPCLDKNERMFDKMTNLACSSIVESSSRMGGGAMKSEMTKRNDIKVKEEPNIPAYIPSNRRYVCCSDSCNYLCLEESNLRHHLHALHLQDAYFTCSHCKMNLKTDIEAYLKHLKLHDLHLYKCPECNFVHNLRHKVDKHLNDKHPDRQVETITIRSMEAESFEMDQIGGANDNTPPPATQSAMNIKWTKPWHCGMCKYRCAARSDMMTHIFNKHDINMQFKCTLCSYKTNESQTFDGHFKDHHPDNAIDIIYVYYRSENPNQKQQFDTTPLWQRDRPRVRHIRGILFEETSPIKGKKLLAKTLSVLTPPQTTTTTTQASSSSTPPNHNNPSTSFSNLDLAIEAVAKGMTTSTIDLAIEAVAKGFDEITKTPKSDDDDGGQNLMIDERMDLKIKEEEEEECMPNEEEPQSYLCEDLLIKKYGKMCTPFSKAFKCPFCMKFKHRKISVFVHHLLVELNCLRFKCNSCNFSSITFDTIVAHCKDKHDSMIVTNVKDTPPDKNLIYWLQMVLSYQSKTLIKQTPPPMGEPKLSNTAIECKYCHKWFRFAHIYKAHEFYHWANQTYTCLHCSLEFNSFDGIFQHNFLVHPMFDISLKINGPSVEQVLDDLRTPQPPTPPSSSSDCDYSCLYCEKVESTIDLLKRHVLECHEGEEFDFKTLPKAGVKIEPIFCCKQCHERGSEKQLMQHYDEKHPNQKFDVYQVICLECSETFMNLKDLRVHFGSCHSGKKLTYSCIENKPGGVSKNMYCCMKCPFRSTTVAGIRSHLRKHIRPIECLNCQANFVYPTDARAHHAKEHQNCEEKIEENKEKLKEYEDLVQLVVAAKEKCSAAPPVRKMLARKSTGAPFIKKEEVRKEDS